MSEDEEGISDFLGEGFVEAIKAISGGLIGGAIGASLNQNYNLILIAGAGVLAILVATVTIAWDRSR
jgi:hypothetical protein